MADEFFLSRWSRLKHRSRQDEPQAEAPPPQPPAAPTEAAPAAVGEPADAPELPPVESLTGDSDFTPFMKADVDPNLRRQALRTLFRDPRFNVMDGLDVYIDDFSKPDPIPPEWLGQMTQMARLGLYQEPAEEAPKAAGDTAAGPADEALQAAETPAPVAASDTVAEADASSEVEDSEHLRAGK
jgi:hypothetical protein